ncbi:hypothetical protein BSLG_004295 [Batrachochytrium salamandrivorans]|nr:hypothetical protein BSLG_004295 [Batrachochytrium salamandrivorans]
MERVLCQPGGSLLLAGRPGIPYSNLALLVSSVLCYTVVSPKVMRKDSTKSFIADLKLVLQTAGGDAKDVVFLDSHAEAGFRGSITSIFQRVRQHLHVVLVLDSASAISLHTLKEASAYVDKLSNDAKKQQTDLTIKQSQADVALSQITESMVQAAEQKREMEELTVLLRDEEVKAILESKRSKRNLQRLNHLSEAQRPQLEIFDRKHEGISRSAFHQDEIMNFDAHNISKQTRHAVNELIQQKPSSFEEATIKRVSVAAAPLAIWVKANLQYSTVIEKVAPLEQDLLQLTTTLDSSRSRISGLKKQLGFGGR